MNLIVSSVSIKLGIIKLNKKVDMLLSNNKLVDRETNICDAEVNIPYKKANELLLKYGSVRKAVNSQKK